MKLETVEDYLEVLAGFQGDTKIKIESTDCTILYSIAKQVFRGKALTDRQLDVVCLKLNQYSDQFTTAGYINLGDVVSMQSTRQPLRSVDRSQWIRIVDKPVMNKPQFVSSRLKKATEPEPSKDSYVAIRFPFSKKIIMLIETLAYKHRQGYYHEKGTHIHYFKITENTLYDIVKAFENKNYDIDSEILEYVEQIKDIKNNPKDYVPGVYDLELKNTTTSLNKKITNHLGELSAQNVYLYKDRSLLYGLTHFDDIHTHTNSKSILTQRIIKRIEPSIFISQNEWHFDAVVSSVVELKRFPLLIVLPDTNILDHLSKTDNSFKGFIKPDKISVMFRLDNKTDKEFNQYIKDHNLNNSLAKDTQVVYISSSKKFPKPLFNSDWQMESVLFLESIRNTKLEHYLVSDLIIHYDEIESQFGTYTKGTGTIQKI
jgi:hypothetical protein